MLAFAVRRIAISIPILLIAAFIVFALGTSAGNPLDPLLAKNPPAPPNVIAAETARLHLDQPLIPRFFSWIGGVLQGDFGPSVVSTQDIGAELAGRFFVTLRLIALAMVIALVLAIVVGVVSAVKQYSLVDYTATFLGFLFLAMPSFWLAILLKQAGIDFNVAVGEQVLYTIGASSVPPPPELGARIVDVLGHMVLPDDRAGADLLRVLEPVPARLDARGDEQRLHPAGPGQGTVAAHGDGQARAAHGADPADHRHRAGPRRDHRRRGRHRDRVPVERHGRLPAERDPHRRRLRGVVVAAGRRPWS